MDNQTIDIVSEGEDGIRHALAIIWNAAAPGGKASYYKVAKYKEDIRYYGREIDGKYETTHHCTSLKEDPEGITTLILLWHEENNSKRLPFPLNQEKSAQFIIDWLEQVDFGEQPDHDGDNGRGWRIFTEAWGHVAGHHYAIIAVQPEWAMYGK